MKIETTEKRWIEISRFVPLHLLRLQFRLEESTFQSYLTELEKATSTAADGGLKTLDQNILKGEKTCVCPFTRR